MRGAVAGAGLCTQNVLSIVKQSMQEKEMFMSNAEMWIVVARVGMAPSSDRLQRDCVSRRWLGLADKVCVIYGCGVGVPSKRWFSHPKFKNDPREV